MAESSYFLLVSYKALCHLKPPFSLSLNFLPTTSQIGGLITEGLRFLKYRQPLYNLRKFPRSYMFFLLSSLQTLLVHRDEGLTDGSLLKPNISGVPCSPFKVHRAFLPPGTCSGSGPSSEEFCPVSCPSGTGFNLRSDSSWKLSLPLKLCSHKPLELLLS